MSHVDQPSVPVGLGEKFHPPQNLVNNVYLLCTFTQITHILSHRPPLTSLLFTFDGLSFRQQCICYLTASIFSFNFLRKLFSYNSILIRNIQHCKISVTQSYMNLVFAKSIINVNAQFLFKFHKPFLARSKIKRCRLQDDRKGFSI